MRIACSTSLFADEPLEEALRGVSELGFELVDLLLIDGWAHVDPSGLAADWQSTAWRVQELLDESSLRLIALNCGFSVPLHERTPDACAKRRREAAAVARFADLHAVSVAGVQPDLGLRDVAQEELFDGSLDSMRELEETSASNGVSFALECHARSAFEQLPSALRLVERAPWLSLAYDPSHFVMQGLELRETRPLLERAAHVHLRDAAPGAMQAPMGEGSVDFDWLSGALRDCGYSGDISIEYLPGAGFDAADSACRLRDYLRERSTW